MRLIDALAQNTLSQLYTDQWGIRQAFDAPPCVHDRARRANLRYIVDDDAARQCGDLIHGPSATDLLEPSNPLLRLPEGDVWLEWRESPSEDECKAEPAFRLATLLDVRAGGRAGRIEAFYEQDDGTLVMFPCHVEFDLEDASLSEATAFVMRHQELNGVNNLLRRAKLCTDHRWVEYCRMSGKLAMRELVSSQARYFWYILSFVFVFSALLNTPGTVSKRDVNLDRLNRRRARNAKLPLLSHIEVSIILGERASTSKADSQGRARQTPRLHFVRGHPVRRGGKTYWRTSHFRGDSRQQILSRTVRVKSSASPVASDKSGVKRHEALTPSAVS